MSAVAFSVMKSDPNKLSSSERNVEDKMFGTEYDVTFCSN
jgi:hypothetical protein